MKSLTASRFVGVALAAVAAAPVSAEPRNESYQRYATVYVADLDLGREPDARVLYERIDYAARSICTPDELSFAVRKQVHWRRCVEVAIANAVDRANAPLLTAIHSYRREQLARL